MRTYPTTGTLEIKHNRESPNDLTLADNEEHPGVICLLLRDGRLVGPFPSAYAARFFARANSLAGYSTYDLIPPTRITE